jgi:hypothetical protein
MNDEQENHFLRQMLEVKDRELKMATQKIKELQTFLARYTGWVVNLHAWASSNPEATIPGEELLRELEALLKGGDGDSKRAAGLQRADDPLTGDGESGDPGL